MTQTPTPSAVKTGSVQVKFFDGSEHALPVHSMSPLELLWLADEIGMKEPPKTVETTVDAEAVLAIMRVILRAAASALTFPKIGEIWTAERVAKTLADADQVAKVFDACCKLSTPMHGQDPKSPPQTRKQTPYH